ncbi:MAG: DUF4159 domain-containing protein [Candidatus Eisenbacteria bacterium]|nr:DUF4159 domain-containing protein [Candidatus Eisenbacteria bacterium]
MSLPVSRIPRHGLMINLISNGVSSLMCGVVVIGVMLTTPLPAGAGVGFRAARLKYGGGGDWYSNPSSLPNLMSQVHDRTGIAVEGDGEEARVGLDDPSLYLYPLLYLNGHGEVKFTESELATLREYLESGGFLWADDNYGMDASFRREMRRLYPETPLVELPFDHPIYHSFYSFPGGLPKIHEHDGKPAQGFGLFRDGRLVALYTYETDIGDGIEDAEVHNDSPAVREMAMQVAVNIVVYVMTH